MPLSLSETTLRMVLGPIAGAILMLAMLSLLAGAALVGRWALLRPTLPRLVQLAPFTLLVLVAVTWALISVGGPWSVVAVLYGPFVAAWLVLGRAVWLGEKPWHAPSPLHAI